MNERIITINTDVTNLRPQDVVYHRGLKTPFRVVSTDGRTVVMAHCKTGRTERVTTKPHQIYVWKVVDNLDDIFADYAAPQECED